MLCGVYVLRVMDVCAVCVCGIWCVVLGAVVWCSVRGMGMKCVCVVCRGDVVCVCVQVEF